MSDLKEQRRSEQDVAPTVEASSREPSHPDLLEKSAFDSDGESSDVTQYSDASDDDRSEDTTSNRRAAKAQITPRRRSVRIRELSEDL